jgi:GNAT superfamily N-acetyltransferase
MGWLIAGCVVAGIVIALGAAMALFANRRSARATAAAADDGVLTDVGILELTATRRRREGVPTIRVADANDDIRLEELAAQSQPGLEGSGLGALPAPALREGDGPASLVLVAGRPAVAFIRVDEVDGAAHVDQLVITPAAGRRGIGRALLDAAIDWAARRDYPALTLSTFVDSEWTEQVYDPSGFVAIEALTPGLAELRDWERAIGLDAIGARVVMRRELTG